MFEQERAAFQSLLCKMCSVQRSVPKSMRITCRYDERTVDGGRPNVFRGEDRGRPVAIKVVRLRPTNDLEISPSVCPPQSH